MRHGAGTISYCQIITLEKYSRGRRGAPAKGIGRVDRREGSNPSFSALIWKYELFNFFEKSCWQVIELMILYMSCREKTATWTLITEQWINLERFNENYSATTKCRCELLWNFKEPLKTVNSDFRNEQQARYSGKIKLLTWEFDPGSGWTLAACLTHASRTKQFNGSFRMEVKLTEWRTGE